MKNRRNKYGFFTAVSVVTGSVIGSGVFYKAEEIARVTGGSCFLGILSWISGGMVMMLCLLCFGLITSAYGGNGGLSGIFSRLCGEKYSYYAGWFTATVYYPAFVSVLARLTARYTLITFGYDGGGGLCFLLSALILLISFGQNLLFPSFSGKVQIVTLIIKLIPLVLMAVYGILSGITKESFTSITPDESFSGSFFPAVTATLFAYEGWISAASIGGELKNSRRNMPLALITGGVITATVYVSYYMGITGASSPEDLINYGAGGIRRAFESLFTPLAGAALTGFVSVSCLGALNGMMMGCGRAMYELALMGNGPLKKYISRENHSYKARIASFFSGLGLSLIWMLFLSGIAIEEKPFFRQLSFDSTKMPVVTLYVLYIPLFLAFIIKHGKERFINIIIPFFAICACLFTIICALSCHNGGIISYLCSLTAIMLAGSLFFSNST